MVENKKVTLKQLMEAAAVLMRFLDEYQAVDRHNTDAIVEYGAKVALVAIPLNIKKYERASSYSLVDLLQRKGEEVGKGKIWCRRSLIERARLAYRQKEERRRNGTP
jgi:hypothetical protein